jgi:hypothetical protein
VAAADGLVVVAAEEPVVAPGKVRRVQALYEKKEVFCFF